MTDKKLLELAAKAAGIDLVTWSKPVKFAIKGSTPLVLWNPLTDDGDALRLAVKLKMLINVMTKSVQVDIEKIEDAALENIDGDPYAATRHAIVRAAAEIGKTK
jgi:hypothetical protein